MKRRTPADPLVAALVRYFGDIRDLRHVSTDWHSATFSGARHVLHFTLDSDALTGERLRAIAETELPMARGFVADVAMVSSMSGSDGRAVVLEVLTIGG